MDLNRIYRISKNLEQLRMNFINLKLALDEGSSIDYYEKLSIPLFPSLINALIEDLEVLTISKESIKELKNLTEEINDLLKNDIESKNTKGDFNKNISNICKNTLFRIQVWEDRIQRELQSRQILELYNNTIVNPVKLLNGGISIFNSEMWNRMPDLEKEDLNDGCKCLLLEIWTPAAMILMRVVESGLRSYYHKETKKDPSGKNWKAILNELNSYNSVDKKLLSYFDYLRDYRNQLQHPDARFDQSDAEDVLTQTIHILKRIYS